MFNLTAAVRSDSLHFACTCPTPDTLTSGDRTRFVESHSTQPNFSMETTLSSTGDSPKPTSEDAAGYQNTLLNDHRIAEEVYKTPENNVFLETDTVVDWRDDLTYFVDSEKTTTKECQTVQQQTSSKLFENACFKIKESRTAGLGAFAATVLKKGDIILRERPLFTATASNVIKAFEKLTCHDKDIALSLHANALLKPGTPRIQAVWKTNCFAITATVAGLFPVASRFNHACHPSQNIGFSFDQHKGLLILWVRAEHVAVGEELKISYRTNHTPEDLYHLYGFLCQCGTCSGINEEQAIMIRSQW